MVPGHTRKFASISKTRTFSTPSKDSQYIIMRLSRNIENACSLLRRYGRETGHVTFFLKTQKFRYQKFEAKLAMATNIPSVLLALARDNFNKMYRTGELYRATGVVVTDIHPVKIGTQRELFGSHIKTEKFAEVFDVVDEISDRFGKNMIHLATSMNKGGDMAVGPPHFGIPNLGRVI